MSDQTKVPPSTDGDDSPRIRRLNKLPVIGFLVLLVGFIGVVVYGISQRGIFRHDVAKEETNAKPASNFADQMKAGVSNGVIEEPHQAPPASASLATPAVQQAAAPAQAPFGNQSRERSPFGTQPAGSGSQESDKDWRDRLTRQQEEQRLQELQRQRMKRLQSADAAYDSPIAVNLSDLEKTNAQVAGKGGQQSAGNAGAGSASDLYSAALKAAQGNQATSDPNGQNGKEEFYTSTDLAKAGYLDKSVVAQQSAYELKRGSVLPATLITGINSDLPGRIIAQVRENVYDSATGYRLLIPQGSKLLGRYDSKVSYGQSRVLVIWTDLIFPNGSTLQIGGMAGTDTEGYGGFEDKVDNHYLRIFGSAALVALIGAGIDAAAPNTSSTVTTSTDAAKESFVAVFGRVAEKTISKNMDVQPTIEIRPGYNFSVLVDQDIIFPGAYNG